MFSKSVGPFTRQTFFSFTGLEDWRGDVQSIQRTRPSWSYSTNVGRTGAMSFATSIGSFVVVMMMAGMPFLRPSAMKLRSATSFPTNAGPTKRTFELKGMPPSSRSSRRGVPVLTRSAFFSMATASSASASPAAVVMRALTAPSRISNSFSFWYVRRLNSSSRSRSRCSHASSWASRSRSFMPGVLVARPSRAFPSSSLALELLVDPRRILVALAELALQGLDLDLLLADFLLLREDLRLPILQLADPRRLAGGMRRLESFGLHPELRLLELELFLLLEERGPSGIERLLEFLQPRLAVLDGLVLRLRRAHLRRQLDRGALDLLFALREGGLSRADGLAGLLEFLLEACQVAVLQPDLLGLRLDLGPGRCDLSVELPELVRALLDRDFAGRDVAELALQILRLIFQFLLQGLEVRLAAAQGPLLVVQRLPLLLVILLDDRDFRVVRLQDLPLVDRGRRRDDVQEGSRDLRREGADQVDDDEQRPAALRFDCEVGREQREEDHQDGHDQRGPEAAELPRAESLPREPHRDDRQGHSRGGDRVNQRDDPERQASLHRRDDRDRDGEEQAHARRRRREVPGDVVPSIRFPLQADGIPGRQGAGHGREEPEDVVQAQARDRQRPSREGHEECPREEDH